MRGTTSKKKSWKPVDGVTRSRFKFVANPINSIAIGGWWGRERRKRKSTKKKKIGRVGHLLLDFSVDFFSLPISLSLSLGLSLDSFVRFF